MTTTAGAVSGYNLAPPSMEDALTSLGRIGGPEKAREMWTAACSTAGVSATPGIGVEEMKRVCEHLKSQGGIVGVVGGSLLIRIQSYLLLSKKEGA